MVKFLPFDVFNFSPHKATSLIKDTCALMAPVRCTGLETSRSSRSASCMHYERFGCEATDRTRQED